MQKGKNSSRQKIEELYRKGLQLVESGEVTRVGEVISELRSLGAHDYARKLENSLSDRLLSEAADIVENMKRIFGEERKESPYERYLRLGRKSLEKGRYSEAEKWFLKAKEEEPFTAEIYEELFRLYKKARSYSKMVDALENWIVLDHENPEPYYELGKYYYSRRRYGKAVPAIERGLKAVEDPRLYHLLGKVLYDWGKVEEAKEAFRAACRLDFKNFDYRHKLLEVLVNEEQYDEALELAHSTLQLYPDSSYLMQILGTIYSLVGDDKSAEYYFRKSVQVSDPITAGDAKKVLADFFVEKGLYDQAEEVLKELVTDENADWVKYDAFMELAAIFVEQGRLAELIRYGKELLKGEALDEDERSELLELIADAYYEEGKVKEAKEYYREALKLSDDAKRSDRIKKNLRELEEIDELNRLLGDSS